MADVMYIRVTQYQKHLIKDLLEDNEIYCFYDKSIADDLILLRCDPFGKKIINVEVKDYSDAEYSCTIVAFNDIQKMINGDIEYNNLGWNMIPNDKIYLARTELSILLHQNGNIILSLPYSYTPIYKRNEL